MNALESAMPRVIAIDPGTTQSGWVRLRGDLVVASGVENNVGILKLLDDYAPTTDLLAIEMIASYGMAVGAEVFETCVWIGRFIERWPYDNPMRCTRLEVKHALCHSVKATDANVRQALLDRYGGKDNAVGRKAQPGPLYGVKSHAWAALAVGVVAADKWRAERRAELRAVEVLP